ncbi:MAG: glycosyltransferase [Actinomycetota bacterium]|nr:glycosyltransferase [Actinomycetota bacterium]
MRTSVVIATRNRRAGLLQTIARLRQLPEHPPVLVVDNGSTDGTPDAVDAVFPEVTVLRLGRNLGAPARNIGVAKATTPYVAFADDDSYWAPRALDRAADLFDQHPRLALVGARVLVGDRHQEDPTSAAMAASPLPAPSGGAVGPSVLGFLACGAVVRRSAFLEVGGFDDLLFFLGEEQRVALDLAAASWQLVYCSDVVAHHNPSPPSDPEGRRRRQWRNQVLTAWLRRSPVLAATLTAELLKRAPYDPVARGALAEVVVRLPAALRRRRRVPDHLERAVRLLDQGPVRQSGT